MTSAKRQAIRRWARLLLMAAVVGLAANFLVHTFPLEGVRVVYDRY